MRTIASCEEELSGLIDGSNHSSDTALLSAAESADALCRERLRAGEALVARLAEEFSRASEAVRSLERDMASVEIEIASLWEKLRDAGNECARLWRRRRDVREELSGRAGARELEDLRLARLRKHLGDAGKRVSSVDLGHREVDRQIENVERERAQLIDSWEEQYPYPGVREGVGESDLAGIWNTVRRYERDLKAIGAYDLGVLSEDSSLADRIGFLNENFEDLRAGETELCRLIEETDRYVGTLFGNALTDIAARFSDLFRHLLGGGDVDGGEAGVGVGAPEHLDDQGVAGREVGHVGRLAEGQLHGVHLADGVVDLLEVLGLFEAHGDPFKYSEFGIRNSEWRT